MDEIVWAKRSQRLPTVLSRQEVARLFHEMEGTTLLMAQLLYGGGLRLLECCRLRAKDIDFERRQILVRAGKGKKDRATLLPRIAEEALRAQLQAVAALHREDLARDAGWVELPEALAAKYPNAGRALLWQSLF